MHAARHPQAMCNFFEELTPHIKIDFRHKVTGGGGSGGAAARKWSTQYTFNVETEVQGRSQAGRVVAIISDNSNKGSSGTRAYGDSSGTP